MIERHRNAMKAWADRQDLDPTTRAVVEALNDKSAELNRLAVDLVEAHQPRRDIPQVQFPKEAKEILADTDTWVSDDGKKILSQAREESQRLNHNYIGTEHLLLGIVKEGSVAPVLRSRAGKQMTIWGARDAVEFIIGRGDRKVMGEIGYTPRAKKVMKFAAERAAAIGDSQIGPEAILWAIVQEGEGIASGVIESLGINLEDVKANLQQMNETRNP